VSILGVDCSRSAVDLVVLDDDSPHAEWVRLPLPGDAAAGARHLRHTFPRRSWFEDRGVRLAGIEEPYSDHPNAAKALGRITGAILALLPPELDHLMIAPQTWRKQFIGTAKADKEAGLLMLVELWPGYYEAWLPELRRHHRITKRIPLDAVDAYAIAWAARAIDERNQAQAA
jgi:Holliday junction resolvasome RuvABC endonuclease subunit